MSVESGDCSRIKSSLRRKTDRRLGHSSDMASMIFSAFARLSGKADLIYAFATLC